MTVPAQPGAQTAERPWPVNGARYQPPAVQRPPAQPFPPLGGRTPRRPRRIRALNMVGGLVAVVGTLGVTTAAFTLSFDAIADTARAAHIRPSIAWLFPVAVDGAMAVAVVCAVLLRQLGRAAWYPWLVVLAGASISVACNALHAYVAGGRIALPREWAMAVSAMPAVLLALSVHLVVVLALAARAPGLPSLQAAERAIGRAPEAPELPEAPSGLGDRAPVRAPAHPADRAGGTQDQAPEARAPTAQADQPKPRPAKRAPASRGIPTPDQLVATLGAHHPSERLTKEQAAATLRWAHGSCSDRRADAARKAHNARS